MSRYSSTAKHILIVVAVYFVCFGSFALVSVPFWDDWVLTLHDADGLWQMFSQLGRREQYFMMAPFAALGHPMIWAIASFICWGIVALCAYGILRGIGWVPGDAFWAAILTAAFPLNQSRFALAVMPYSISAALFATALLLVVVSISYRKIWLRIVAAGLLLLSFTTNSFLTMSLLAPLVAFLALRQGDPQKRFWPAVRGTLLHVELFALPFVYWASKALLQPVYGIYADYNQFRIGPVEGLGQSVSVLTGQFPDWSVFFPTRGHFIEAGIIAVAFIALLLASMKLTRVDARTEKGNLGSKWLQVACLVTVAMLALFPYVMVGLRPAFGGLWETRHQTTLAVIAGTLAFAALRAVLPSRLVPASCAVVLCGFTAMDVSVSRQLLADIYDSNAIIHSPQVAAIPENTLVAVFEDNQPYRMMGRQFRFYELSAMLNARSSEKTVMAMSSRDAIDPATGTFPAPGSTVLPAAVAETCARWVQFPEYGFGDINADGRFAELRLVPKSDPPAFLEGLAFSAGFLFNRQETINRAVANLDVTVQMRSVDNVNCAAPG